MRRRLILLVAVLTECLLLFPLLAHRDRQPDPALVESTQWRDDPTPETERALRREMVWEHWRPRLLWVLLVLNGAFIVLSATRWLRSGTYSDPPRMRPDKHG